MAALTASFEHAIQGNKRVVYATVSAGLGSSADAVIFPHLTVITGGVDFTYTAAPGANPAAPILSISGTTVNIQSGTTGIAFVLNCEGR